MGNRAHRISQASHAPDTRGLSEAAVHDEQGLHLGAPIVAGTSMVRTPVSQKNSLHRPTAADTGWNPRKIRRRTTSTSTTTQCGSVTGSERRLCITASSRARPISGGDPISGWGVTASHRERTPESSAFRSPTGAGAPRSQGVVPARLQSLELCGSSSRLSAENETRHFGWYSATGIWRPR